MAVIHTLQSSRKCPKDGLRCILPFVRGQNTLLALQDVRFSCGAFFLSVLMFE